MAAKIAGPDPRLSVCDQSSFRRVADLFRGDLEKGRLGKQSGRE
jgi:hypothetical protein